MPRSDSNRRLRLIDAMVIISMLALGLAMAKEPFLRMDPEMIVVVGGADYRAWNLAKYYGALALPLVTPLTFALPVLALCRRRCGSLGRALLQPGLGGCVAASAALILRGLEYLPFYLAGAAWHLGPIDPWVVTGEKAGYAVIGAWAMLALARRWRLGSGWLERIAIVVGSLWTLAAIGSVAVVLRVRGGELLRSLHWF